MGTPRLLRSVTRDPGGFDPARVAPDTIFNETLIHDFDTLAFLNPGAAAVEVARRGVTVNAVAPGLIDTEFISEVSKDLLQAVPARRVGNPEEVAVDVCRLTWDPESIFREIGRRAGLAERKRS